MTEQDRGHHPSAERAAVRGSGRGRRPTAGAAALLLVGGLLGGAAVRALGASAGPTDPGPVATPAPASSVASTTPSVTDAPTAPQAAAPGDPAARVTAIDLPKITVHSRLVDLHLDLDGTIQVPADYGVAGWYSDGPTPGTAGAPAVVVGHVDSKTGPGVFYRLASLVAGDAVLLTRADGQRLRFVVYSAADYPKDAFPTDQVYAATAQPELRLITCTGTFDRAEGHYRSNRVVYARQAAP